MAGHREADAADFTRVFREHRPQLLRFFVRRTRDAAISEDLVSAVFVEAWRRRTDVDLTTRPAAPWLYAVAVNVDRNYQRSLRRHNAALRRVPAVGPQPDTTEDVAERLDAAVRAGAAIDALRALPPVEREVVLLFVDRDLSYRAAAAALDVPIGTVRSRLSRARARLAQAAGPHEARTRWPEQTVNRVSP